MYPPAFHIAVPIRMQGAMPCDRSGLPKSKDEANATQSAKRKGEADATGRLRATDFVL
jgi:hypothetical protein